MQNRDLTEKATLFFELAQENPKGKKLIDSITWTQIVKFIVDKKPEFYLDIKKGAVAVFAGDVPKKDDESEFYEVSRVYIDAETLNELLEGKKDSVDVQYSDEALKVLPGGKYYTVTFIHQLFRFGRQELLENKKMRP